MPGDRHHRTSPARAGAAARARCDHYRPAGHPGPDRHSRPRGRDRRPRHRQCGRRGQSGVSGDPRVDDPDSSARRWSILPRQTTARSRRKRSGLQPVAGLGRARSSWLRADGTDVATPGAAQRPRSRRARRAADPRHQNQHDGATQGTRRKFAPHARASSRAGDDARRGLERDLHDGAQQRLVSLSLSLRLAEAKLATTRAGGRDPRCGAARSSRTPSRSYGSSRAASTPRCSPTAASRRRSRRWSNRSPIAVAAHVEVDSARRPRSRLPPTTSSPRR